MILVTLAKVIILNMKKCFVLDLEKKKKNRSGIATKQFQKGLVSSKVEHKKEHGV